MENSVRKKAKVSISAKLMVILLLISIIPVTVLGVAAGKLTYDRSLAQSKLSLEQNVNKAGEVLKKNFDIYNSQINMLSNSSQVVRYYKGEENAEDTMKYLYEMFDSESSLETVYFGFEDKRYLFQINDGRTGYDPTERSWYTGAMENPGQIYYMPPEEDFLTKKLLTTISKTIYDGDKIIGVAAIDITLDNMQALFSNMVIGEAGFLEIIANNNIVVTSPNPERIGVILDEADSIFSKVSGSENGYFNYEENGNKYLGYFVTDEVRGWKYVGVINEQEYLSKAYPVLISILIVAIASIVISLIVSGFIARWVKKIMNNLENMIEKMANGDFTHRLDINSNDELGVMSREQEIAYSELGATFEQTRDIASEVRFSAENFSSSAKQASESVEHVSIALDDFAQANQNQAEDMSESVNAVNDLSIKIDESDNIAKEMHNLFEDTMEVNSLGLESMDELSNKSENVMENFEKIEVSKNDMLNSTAQIDLITAAIREISDQTSLLALNASIEAARAGESGAGFAVVAGQIGKLADQTQEQVEQIKALIDKVQENSDILSEKIENSVDAVTEQNKSIVDIQDKFKQMSNQTRLLTQKNEVLQENMDATRNLKNQIFARLENLSATIEEGSATIEEISASTEQISAAFQEFTVMAESLKEMSEELNADVEKFKF